ncbi:MAG: hypothetical protein IJW67_10970 [Blautia sp.]|nr:hypothetical protein [Blautia sp.]
MNIENLLRDIGGRMASGRKIPEELIPYSCFVPDSGYCIMCIPKVFAEKAEENPARYCVPLPEKYVVDKGYSFVSGVPCVDVQYSRILGAIVPEGYETWR